MSAGSELGYVAGVGIFSAFTLDLFGLPAQPIVYAFMGGFIGVWLYSPQTEKPLPKWVVALMYVCASMISAAIGHGVATAEGWSSTFGNVSSATLAIFFHLILAAGAQRIVPAIVDRVLSFLGKVGPQ